MKYPYYEHNHNFGLICWFDWGDPMFEMSQLFPKESWILLMLPKSDMFPHVHITTDVHLN